MLTAIERLAFRQYESATGPHALTVPAFPHCPCCGDETSEVVKSCDGDIVGCSDCVRTEAAEWESEEAYPYCPVCGAETDDVVYNRFGELAGCRECLSYVDAWDEESCLPNTTDFL